MHRRNRRILKALVLGVAVAAFAAPAALAEPRGPGNSSHPDFWNYDAATGEKIADTSPGVAPADLAGLYSVSGASTGADDRSFYRGISPQLDPTLVGSPDDRAVFRGVETPNLSPAIQGELIRTLNERRTLDPVSQPTSSVSTDDGFQWTDAWLGAASTLGLVLLMGAAGIIFLRHQRRRIPAY